MFSPSPRPLGPRHAQRYTQRFAQLSVALACSACLLGAMASGTVFAQGSASTAGTAAQHNLALPAQPLAQTLTALSQQFNVSIGADAALLQGRSAPALQGAMTLDQALAKALAASPLRVVRSSAAGYSVVPAMAAPEAGAGATLPEVTVAANAVSEQANGPVGGLVAQRTATGTKTDTALIETPQSVSVISAEAISDLGAQSVSQALRYSAGVVADNSGFETRFDWMNLRGYSASTLGMYLNGMRVQSNTEIQVDPYALERVEVLRGPSSVLYGQNAPGGIINMVTKQPTEETLRELQLRLGSFNNKQLGLDLGGKLSEDGRVSYRLTGLLRDSGTQVDHTPNDRVYLAPSIKWKLTNDTSITLQASYQRDKLGFGQFLPAQGTALPNPNGRIDVSRFIGEPGYDKITREQTMVGYALEHRANDAISFRQNARFAYLDYQVRTDGYGFGFITQNAANPTDPANFRSISRLPFQDDRQARVFTLDNQLEAKLQTGALQHRLLAGLDLYRYQTDRSMHQGTARNPLDLYAPSYGTATLAGMRQTTNTDTSMQQLGLYLQDQISLGEHWRFTLGARRDWARQTVDNRLNAKSTSQSDAANSLRAAVMYLTDSGLAPYLSYSESFQPNIGTDVRGGQFGPTRGKQWEAGLKYQPHGFRGFFTASVFDTRMSNVLDADANAPGFYAATGERRNRGLELEAVAELNRNVKLIASYTYIDARNTKTTDPTLRDTRPTQQPRNVAAIWADYTQHTGTLAGLGASLGVRYSGATFIDSTNKLGQAPARTLLDLGIHYQVNPQWLLRLDVSNLTDKVYAICVNPSQCAFGARRTAAATATYRW